MSNVFESKVSICARHSSVSFSYWRLLSPTDSHFLAYLSAVELRVATMRGSAWPRIVRVAFKILKQHFVDTSQLSSPNLAVPYLCLLLLASWRSPLENYERTVQKRDFLTCFAHFCQFLCQSLELQLRTAQQQSCCTLPSILK